MRQPTGILLIASLIFTACCVRLASADTAVYKADKLFLLRSDFSKAAEALEIYKSSYKAHPADAQIAWRVSMACYFYGFEIAKTQEEKKKYFEEGREAGLASISINPDSAPACFWTAVNMALYGQTAGVFKMLFTLGTVRGYLQKSLKHDPVYAYGGAYRILGKIEQELPGILGGSNEQARQYYLKAIKAVPDEPLNYLFLSELQYRVFNDKQGALETIEKALSFPVPDISRHESLWGLNELKALKGRIQ